MTYHFDGFSLYTRPYDKEDRHCLLRSSTTRWRRPACKSTDIVNEARMLFRCDKDETLRPLYFDKTWKRTTPVEINSTS